MATNLSQMRKEDLAKELILRGEEYHPKATVIELRSHLKEVRGRQRPAKEPGLDPGARKAEVQAAAEKHGLIITEKETKGDIMRKLRTKLEENQAEVDTAIVGLLEGPVGLGTHPSRTREAVIQIDPHLVRWCRRHVHATEGTPHPEKKEIEELLKCTDHVLNRGVSGTHRRKEVQEDPYRNSETSRVQSSPSESRRTRRRPSPGK